MSEELYNSSDYCSLVEQYEELQKENAELTADKIFLIQAAMDGGDKYHYTAHDIGYRDLERKVKALEADYVISNRELLVKQVEITALRAEIAQRDEIIKRLKENAIILALMLTLNGKFKESELRNFHSVINNHIALMKELE